MKKYFGNKIRTSDYNPRKEEHYLKRESHKMRVKWKISLEINSESAMIISERETTLTNIKLKIVFSRVVDTQHREEVPTTVEIGKGNMEWYTS